MGLVLLLTMAVACGRIGVVLLPLPPSSDSGLQRMPDDGMSMPDSATRDSGPPPCPTVCQNAHGSADCRSGSCIATCAIGYQDCDSDPSNGCETSTADTLSRCGACDMSCANPHGGATCSQGLCTLTCATGYADCDRDAANGCETSLTTVNECASCGASCANAHGATSCTGAACTPSCAAGFADCDGKPENGCEADIARDPTHCGSCTDACNPMTQFCMSGTCQLSPCSPGRGECDGNPNVACETDLTSSVASCGFCGNACMEPNAAPACVSSACAVGSCNSGYADCDGQAADGCEVALATSTQHCGACLTACANQHGTTSCAAGTCVPSCSSGFGDCDSSRQNGCETGLNTVSNCGMCGMTCPADGGTPGCSVGVCTVSCTLTGSFALKLTEPTTWTSSQVLLSGSGSMHMWARLDLTASGNNFSGSLTPCGHDVPDFKSVTNETYGVIYPTTLFDNHTVPSVATAGSLSSTAPGSTLSLAKSAFILGASLADPVNPAWPSASSLAQVDVDADGKPGVSVPYKSGGGYSAVPTDSFGLNRAVTAYLAMRSVFSLSGTLTSCTQGSGTATLQNINTHMLGCRLQNGGDCNSTEQTYLDSNTPSYQQSSGSFSLVKVGDGAACVTVRAAIP